MNEPAQSRTDEELAQRAQRGDAAAFEALVERFETRIYRFALHSCGREADAREVTQDTFVSAYLHLNRFDPARSFATWLFTIARRKCIDRGRRTPAVAGEALPEEPDADDPSVLLARQEAGQALWHTAQRLLPPAQFQALWLRYVEDLAVRDIARVMRRTQPHVRVLLFRARAVLQRELRHRAVAENWETGVQPDAGAVHGPVRAAHLVHPLPSRNP